MNADLASYAGRWVALVGDRVAGVGNTADEALHFAQRNRPKERIQMRFVEKAEGERLPLPPLLDRLLPLLTKQHQPVYLVGGAVRDALLQRLSNDLDFVVPHQAIKLAFQVADELRVPAYVLDQERDTGRVVLAEKQTTLDFAKFRGSDLEADLRDRDFTINAMALPAAARHRSSIIDPCNGAADVANKRIHQTHARAIVEDPVRALRALRLALGLKFQLTSETIEAVKEASAILDTVSAERIRDELLKLLQLARPHKAIGRMDELGLLEATLPEIAALRDVTQSAPHHEPVLAHTISTLGWLAQVEAAISHGASQAQPPLDAVQSACSTFAGRLAARMQQKSDGNIDGRTLLRLGALFHDVGKRGTREEAANGRVRFLGHETIGAALAATRLRRLCLGNKAVSHVRRIVAGHMRPLWLAHSHADEEVAHPVSRRAVYRFFRDTGAAGVDIVLLSLADHLATHDGPGEEQHWQRLLNVCAELLRHYFEHYSETVAPTPLLNGHDLIEALQIRPGPEVGRLLRLIAEAQAVGEISSRDEAIRFAQKQRA